MESVNIYENSYRMENKCKLKKKCCTHCNLTSFKFNCFFFPPNNNIRPLHVNKRLGKYVLRLVMDFMFGYQN